MTSEHRRFKDALYGQFGRVGKALAGPKRMELLDLLCQAPRTVEALAGQAGLSIANASQHLRVLREAGLVSTDRRGQFIEYRLSDPEVGALLTLLRRIAERQLAEVERLTRERFGPPELDAAEQQALLQRVVRGEVTVLDVRPPEEFAAAHLAGAICMPVEELVNRMNELPEDREVVAYCRGPYCAMAVEAVQQLRTAGYHAHRLELGVVELEQRAIGLRRGTDTHAAPATV